MKLRRSVVPIAVCLIIGISLYLPTTAQDTAHPPKETTQLSILSWNIYMLPKFAKITGKRQRAHAIAAQLRTAGYQIIVFQEAFLADARHILSEELGETFPYAYGPANLKFSVKANSGIWILSKFPLTVLEEIDYEQCAGFDDCFARKGALLVSGEYAGHPFQLLGTHLQAGGPQSIRHSQCVEMRQLLDRHRVAGIPQIICGDMNTGQSDTTHYHEMLQALDAADGPLNIRLPTNEHGYPNDLHSDGVRNFRIIDYVFYRANGLDAAKIERSMPHYQSRWSQKHQDLSDHFPVEFEVAW